VVSLSAAFKSPRRETLSVRCGGEFSAEIFGQLKLERSVSDLICTATTASDYESFAALVTQYVEWSRRRYQGDTWFIEQVFGHQSLASELPTLSTKYGPPNGKTLLASRDGQVVGAGAYRDLGDGICEMKRLYVGEQFHGRGTGRKLCEALIATAREDGFKLMRLDTGNLLKEAIAMYRSIGFRECPPYHDYPAKLMPYLIFMEMPLTRSQARY
jgi:ribosomal protein S18 acetylase RimI-like enzyme